MDAGCELKHFCAAWASSPQGGWVPRWDLAREQVAGCGLLAALRLSSDVVSLLCTLLMEGVTTVGPGQGERTRVPPLGGEVSA